jgi:MFS family permease
MAQNQEGDKGPGQRGFFLRNILSIGFVSLFTDISSEMVYPLIPDLVKAAGGGAAALGLIEGIAESSSQILKGFSGYWSDKIAKRKPIVFLGYLLSTLAKPLLGLSHLWQMVLGFRFLDRFGKGIRTSPRDALLADSTGEQKMGQWFGLHRMMDTLGAVLGPLLAMLLLAQGLQISHIFFWAVLPAGLGLLIIQFLVKEVPPARSGQEKFKLEFRGLNKIYHRFLFVSCVFGLGAFSNTFLILRAKDFGFALKSLPLLYLVFNLVSALSSLPAGMLSDRLGRKNVLLVAWFAFAISFLGFGFAKEPWHIWLLFGLFGVTDGIKEGVPKALVSDLVPSQKRASALGIYYAAIGIMTLFSSGLAGLLWKMAGPVPVFACGAGLGAIGFILLALLVSNQINPPATRINQ